MEKIAAPLDRQRLDKYLCTQLGATRSTIKNAIEKGFVLVNYQSVKPSFVVTASDIITVDKKALKPAKKKLKLVPQKMHLDLIYEDDYILIVDKPINMVVHPADMTTEPTLAEGLAAYTTRLSDLSGPLRPGIVHRLDKNTEGLMVIAKTNTAHAGLVGQFKARTVQKRYLAMVYGHVSKDEFEISLSIGRSLKRYTQMAAFHDSQLRAHDDDSDDPFNRHSVMPMEVKKAITRVRVIKRFGTKTLCEVQPITGRTHQIRVHMAHIGHAVLGDQEYGPASKDTLGQRLQAYYLSIEHPIYHTRLTFKIPPSARLFQ